MTDELHKLILRMGFIEHDTDARVGRTAYHHPRYNVTFEPVPDLTLPGLAEALITAGMAVQKLETMEIIQEAAKKLGFKF